MKSKKEAIVTLRLEPEIKEVIESLAGKDQRTVAWMTRQLIIEALKAKRKLPKDFK